MKLLQDRSTRTLLIFWTVGLFLLAPVFILILVNNTHIGDDFEHFNMTVSGGGGGDPNSHNHEDKLSFSNFVAEYNKDYGSDK